MVQVQSSWFPMFDRNPQTLRRHLPREGRPTISGRPSACTAPVSGRRSFRSRCSCPWRNPPTGDRDWAASASRRAHQEFSVSAREGLLRSAGILQQQEGVTSVNAERVVAWRRWAVVGGVRVSADSHDFQADRGGQSCRVGASTGSCRVSRVSGGLVIGLDVRHQKDMAVLGLGALVWLVHDPASGSPGPNAHRAHAQARVRRSRRDHDGVPAAVSPPLLPVYRGRRRVHDAFIALISLATATLLRPAPSLGRRERPTMAPTHGHIAMRRSMTRSTSMKELLTRKQFLDSTARTAVGVSVGVFGGSLITAAAGPDQSRQVPISAPAAAQAFPWPWPYTKLDPEDIRKRAHKFYYDGGCCYGAFNGLVSALAEKIGEPVHAHAAADDVLRRRWRGRMGHALRRPQRCRGGHQPRRRSGQREQPHQRAVRVVHDGPVSQRHQQRLRGQADLPRQPERQGAEADLQHHAAVPWVRQQVVHGVGVQGVV